MTAIYAAMAGLALFFLERLFFAYREKRASGKETAKTNTDVGDSLVSANQIQSDRDA